MKKLTASKVENEFIAYEQALALKELGFNEECFAYYIEPSVVELLNLEKNIQYQQCYQSTSGLGKSCTAPTFSQAFRWFRENCNLCSWVYQSNSALYHYSILRDGRYLSSGYNNQTTYEEAEIACLSNLIELAKSK